MQTTRAPVDLLDRLSRSRRYRLATMHPSSSSSLCAFGLLSALMACKSGEAVRDGHVELERYGLQTRLECESSLLTDEGKKGYSAVCVEPAGRLGIWVSVELSPPSHQQAIDAWNNSPHPPSNLDTERLDDGFAFWFEETVDGKPAFVSIAQRRIGTATYTCQAAGRTREQRARAQRACLELRER